MVDGNCQVSTTLYNAIKKIDNIEVTERHDHSNTVPYAQKGNDAAIAHGSYDFKFVNHNDYNIIIEASSDKASISVTIKKQ